MFQLTGRQQAGRFGHRCFGMFSFFAPVSKSQHWGNVEQEGLDAAKRATAERGVATAVSPPRPFSRGGAHNAVSAGWPKQYLRPAP